MFSPLSVGWLVCHQGYTKLLNGFPNNFDGGRVSAQNRPCKLQVRIWIKGQMENSTLHCRTQTNPGTP